MKPSKEIKDTYRKIIIDAIYKDIDNWFSVNSDYCYDLDNNVRIEIWKKPRTFIGTKPIWISKINEDGNRENLLFDMRCGNSINRFMIKKLRKYMKNKKQTKFDQEMMKSIPFTIKRRLKIEKIYKQL